MPKPRKTYSSDVAMQALGDLISAAVVKWLLQTKPSDVWKTCATCHHMSTKGPAFCSKFKMVPPASVITGDRECEAYSEHDNIPF